MNRHVYHYSARKVEKNGETYFDGIVQLETRIVNMEDYRRLKRLVVTEEEAPVKWTIVSLSFLGMEEES